MLKGILDETIAGVIEILDEGIEGKPQRADRAPIMPAGALLLAALVLLYGLERPGFAYADAAVQVLATDPSPFSHSGPLAAILAAHRL